MPRYASQNLAAIDPEYCKANNIGNNSDSKRRYAYGKHNNVLLAQGAKLFEKGMTLRLLPIYDETARDKAGNREFVNFREGNNQEVFGDWSRVFTCANWVGNPGVCFIIHDGNPDLSLYDSPYHVLRKAAWDSKDVPGIGKLFSELLSKNFVAKSHIGSLRKPESTLFVSASVVEENNTGAPTLLAFGNDKKRNARIIGLKTSAAQALYSALAARDEETGEYLVGDLLSFGPAKLITFVPETFTANTRNTPAISAHGPAGVQVPNYVKQKSPVIVGNCSSPSTMTHRVIVHDTYNNHPVTLEPYADKIVADTLSWDEYMWLPSYEEQAEMLAGAFPREALAYAWQEFPQYLRTLQRNTTTVTVQAGAVEDDAADDEDDASPPFVVKQKAPAAAPPAAEDPEGELSDDEESALDGMFNAATPPTEPAAKVDDIIARARAAASRKR